MGGTLTLPFTAVSKAFNTIVNKGIYYSVIYIISYCTLWLSLRIKKRRFDLYDSYARNNPEKLSFLVPHEEWSLETKQTPSHREVSDDVSCFGVNSKSEYLFVNISRKPDKCVHCTLVLRLSNGKIYSLPEEHIIQKETDEQYTFGSARLRMQCILPIRKWRVFFNGTLQEKSNDDNSSSDLKHVKLAFIWTASSDPFDYETDMSPSYLADFVAQQKKVVHPTSVLGKLKAICKGYSQCGMYLGTVEVEGDDTKELYLWGNRHHLTNESSKLTNTRYREILLNSENGAFLHLKTLDIPQSSTEFHCGSFMRPNGLIDSIEECTINANENQEEIHCKAGEYSYKIKIKSEDIGHSFPNHFNGQTYAKMVEGCIEDKKVRGIVSVGTIGKPRGLLKSHNSDDFKSLAAKAVLCVPIHDSVCQLESLTGGKGSSLSKLYAFSKQSNDATQQKTENFDVPRGVVVTTVAYSKFVKDHLRRTVIMFQNNVWADTSDKYSALCENVMKEMINTDLPDEVVNSVKENLINVFGAQFTELKFAVRSSATGEDTEQMSAAGQMETFLGVRGFDEILLSLKKCWASQFGFIAVQYKRRYGQLLNTPMAVVIQEMVPCDTAGVMFTCDPVTGNAAYITISANYGLGESVVAAAAEPDTIKLERNLKDEIRIHSQEIGSKTTKIVMTDSEGVQTIDLGASESSECCLSEEMALKLGRIAVEIENYYGNPRDIEWGIHNNELYLLQSRPVTSIAVETDFEVRHSSDIFLRREDEYTSKANIGEVMYGSTSTLGLDLMGRMSFVIFPRHIHMKSVLSSTKMSPYYPSGIAIACGHCMFTLSDSFFKFSETKGKNISDYTKAMSVAMFGRVLDDERLFDMAVDRHKTTKGGSGLVTALSIPFMMFFGGIRNRWITKKLEVLKIPYKQETAAQVFKVISHYFDVGELAMISHLECTLASSFWNLKILSLLSQKRGAWDNKVFGDFAFLLSTCTDVESADVPSALQHLSYAISKSISPSKFKEINVEEALEWLSTTTSEAGKLFKDFITKHGHRGIKEFDVYVKTWDMDYTLLIRTLQGIVTENIKDVERKKLISTNTIISKLHINPDFLTRLQLKFLLPNCQRGVRERECSKSLLIKQFHKIREATRYLAKAMVREGRLPHEDLLFFLTFEEIRLILVSRSPALVSKAFRRWKCHPELEKLVFPEICVGMPTPINMTEDIPDTGAELVMTGVPVSQGVVTARACVVQTVQEATNIKAGDILITYATDIGWSPYFPLLSGVVTELGGLVSHGAVVAREYGLPCVVNLHGATRSFKSGDLVLLDGNKGILKRIKSAE